MLRQYLESLIIPDNITHVKIDVGLGECNTNSINWLETEKNLLVLMFDPSIYSISSCSNRMKINNIGKNSNNMYYIIPIALSDVDQPKEMDFYSMKYDSGTSSLYKPVDPNLGPIKEVSSVNTFSLRHFFDIFPWNKFEYIEYIKIDAQGADFDIIKSAGSYLMDKVIYITAEPESRQYENCSHNTSENMEEYLLNNNFIKIDHPNTRDPTFINKKFLHLKDLIYIYQR